MCSTIVVFTCLLSHPNTCGLHASGNQGFSRELFFFRIAEAKYALVEYAMSILQLTTAFEIEVCRQLTYRVDFCRDWAPQCTTQLEQSISYLLVIRSHSRLSLMIHCYFAVLEVFCPGTNMFLCFSKKVTTFATKSEYVFSSYFQYDTAFNPSQLCVLCLLTFRCI